MIRLHKAFIYGAAAIGVLVPSLGAVASAAPVIVSPASDFSSTPAPVEFFGSTFTFSATGDIFNPVSIQTGGDGAVRAFGGFLGFPYSPSTDFPDRGSGILTYGPGTTFASFTDPTIIPYSNGDNYLGLRATRDGQDYYGYAFFTNTTLNSYGYETTPGTAFTINTSTVTAAVPEPASWAMMVIGVGFAGYGLRRRRPSVRVAFG